MPLAFRSRSHGTVAFGFFNIESDLLLLDQLFFFADRFCDGVVELSRSPGSSSVIMPGWRIADPADIGDLHGAIAGVELAGFIGETYRRFPFPVRPEDFKQSPDGALTQPWITRTIARFGAPADVELRRSGADGVVRVAEYSFDRAGFGALIEYVERGGHPRYRDERRPDYVERMMAELGERSPPST